MTAPVTWSLPTEMQTGTHAARPAVSAVGEGALYSCSTHQLVYQMLAGAWGTWYTPPSSGAGTVTTVEEVDGSPTDSAVTKIVFPNGTLAIASHVATYTPAGAGLAQSFIGYNTVGASFVATTATRQLNKKVTLAAAALVESIDVHVRANTDAWVPCSVGVLTDNAGVPNLLVAAASSPYLLLSNASSGFPHTARWVSIPLGVYLAAGDYWLAFACNTGQWDIAFDSGSDVYWPLTGGPGGNNLSGSHSGLAKTTGSNKYSIRASVLT